MTGRGGAAADNQIARARYACIDVNRCRSGKGLYLGVARQGDRSVERGLHSVVVYIQRPLFIALRIISGECQRVGYIHGRTVIQVQASAILNFNRSSGIDRIGGGVFKSTFGDDHAAGDIGQRRRCPQGQGADTDLQEALVGEISSCQIRVGDISGIVESDKGRAVIRGRGRIHRAHQVRRLLENQGRAGVHTDIPVSGVLEHQPAGLNIHRSRKTVIHMQLTVTDLAQAPGAAHGTCK